MLRRSAISPMELAEEYIRQIERLNPRINAFVDFDAERVREQVRAAERSKLRGPLLWAADDGEVVDCDGGLSMRNRQHAESRIHSCGRCGGGGAHASRRALRFWALRIVRNF